MKWQEVIAEHGTFRGVAIKNDRVSSLLAGGEEHNDDITDSVIRYEIPKSRGYASPLKYMEIAFEFAHTFTVYQKLAVNDWRDLGTFKIKSRHDDVDSLTFDLVAGKSERVAK